MSSLQKPTESDVLHWKAPEGDGAKLSFFEFWPTWLIYLPVALDWMRLSLQYRSLTLPLLANPNLPVAGMVGVPKSQLMGQAVGKCQQAILPWTRHVVDDSPLAAQALTCIAMANAKTIHFPFVVKPDIGCRGAGVKLIQNESQLEILIGEYSVGVPLLCQKLASWEPEAGVFYVRDPETGNGEIVSLTFKYSPWVLGDGRRTLAELVASDERAGKLMHLYQKRHKSKWNRILQLGEKYHLVFSASHCRGAVFRDAREHITTALTQSIHELLKELPGYFYGRLDVKFPDITSLRNGTGIEIIELNGASSESIHIWDKEARLTDALQTLLWQYRTLFRLGKQHRARGLKPPGIRKLWKHWRLERRLTRNYPLND